MTTFFGCLKHGVSGRRRAKPASASRQARTVIVVDSDQIAELVETHRRRIVGALPSASVSLSGSMSVAGLPAEDVDLVVLVRDVASAAERLPRSYSPLFPEQWRDDWAAFRDPGPPQVDIVVMREGTKGAAHHLGAWEAIAQDEALLEEYRALKATPGDYELRKAAFFERVVSRLITKD